MNAPGRARKVARPFRPPGQDGRQRNQEGVHLVLYFIVPLILTGGIAMSVLLYHILFGAGVVGLIVLLATAFLAVGFAITSILEGLRLWRRNTTRP